MSTENDGQEPRRPAMPPEILWTAELMAEELESSNSLLDELWRTIYRFRDKEGKPVSPIIEVTAERKRLQGELNRIKVETTALRRRRQMTEAELSEVNAKWNQAQKDDRLIRETNQSLTKLVKSRAEKKAELGKYLVKWRLLDEDGIFMGLDYSEFR